jgi:hypothetical protein
MSQCTSNDTLKTKVSQHVEKRWSNSSEKDDVLQPFRAQMQDLSEDLRNITGWGLFIILKYVESGSELESELLLLGDELSKAHYKK